MTPHSPPSFERNCGPEGPAAGAKRPHAAKGCEGERSEAATDSTDNKNGDQTENNAAHNTEELRWKRASPEGITFLVQL